MLDLPDIDSATSLGQILYLALTDLLNFILSLSYSIKMPLYSEIISKIGTSSLLYVFVNYATFHLGLITCLFLCLPTIKKVV